MPLLTSIADLIRQQGTDAAERIREDANIRARASQAQAQAIGNIGQTIANVPKQIQQQKQDAQEAQLHGLQIQNLQGEQADKAKQRAKQEKIDTILGKYDDIRKALPELMRADPQAAMQLQQHVDDNDKKIEAERQLKKGRVASILGAATDQGTWAKQLDLASHAYPEEDLSGFPHDFTQAGPAIKALQMSVLSPEKQVEFGQKAAELAAKPPIANETELRMAAGDPTHPLHEKAVAALALKPEASAKGFQSESFLLDGKPVKGVFNPSDGTYRYNGEDVTPRAKPIPPASIMYPQAKSDPLVKVEHKDPTTGKTVIEWLPRSELKGQQFEKGTSATVQNRLASAQAVNQTGDDIIAQLKDPKVRATLGPALGRTSKLQDFIGNPPPEFSELAGSIESYALANMGVHGMRSAQGAEMIKKLLDGKHTPESLIGAIQGLQKFSTHFMENEGVKTPTTQAPKTNPFKK